MRGRRKYVNTAHRVRMHELILRNIDRGPHCGHGQDTNEGRGGRSIKNIGGRGTECRSASTRMDNIGDVASINAAVS